MGLVAAVALDRRRLTFLTAGLLVALPAMATVWLASRAPGLTSISAPRSVIADEGRELAIALLALTAGSVAIALIVGTIERRFKIPRGARLAYGALLGFMAVALIAGTVVQQGGPGPLVQQAYDGLNKNPGSTAGQPGDLNARLGSLGSAAEDVSPARIPSSTIAM